MPTKQYQIPARKIEGNFEGAYLVDGVFQRSLKDTQPTRMIAPFIEAALGSVPLPEETTFLVSITVDIPKNE